MKNLILSFVTISFLVNSNITLAQTKGKSLLMESYFESGEELTKGMTPEMKKKYLEGMEKSKKILEEYEAMTPEQRAKKEADNKKAMEAPDAKEKMKKAMENISEEDKKMMAILMTNMNRKIEEYKKNPNAEEFKKVKKALNTFDERTPKEIIDDPNSGKYDLYNAALGIAKSSKIIDNAEGLLLKILSLPSANKSSYVGVSFALDRSISPIPNANKIFSDILDLPNMDNDSLVLITKNYYNSPKKLPVEAQSLKKLLNHKNSSKELIDFVEAVVKKSLLKTEEKTELLNIISMKK